jgi:hypothetical protein
VWWPFRRRDSKTSIGMLRLFFNASTALGTSRRGRDCRYVRLWAAECLTIMLGRKPTEREIEEALEVEIFF